jgi:hypothetical protein
MKSLPDKLALRYLESQSDPELLNMRSDIALVDARVEQLLDSTKELAPYIDFVGGLRSSLNEFKAAAAKADGAGMSEALGRLDAIVADGEADIQTWQQIIGLLEMRRKLVDQESKRLVAMHQMVTAEEAMALVGKLLAVVKLNVQGRPLQNIADEFARITQSDRH